MAAAPAALAGQVAAKEGAGIVKAILNALERDVVHFHFERDPKNYKRMRLESFDININTGLILGLILCGLGWEAANWFAQALSKDADVASAILNPAQWTKDVITMDFSLSPILTALGLNKPKTPGAPTTATAPSTFGAAYNSMLRDLTVAGPGLAASSLRDVVAKALLGNG